MYPNSRLFSLTLLFISIFPAFSQQNTRSPYSLFGVGLMHFDGFADNAANGRNGFSYRHESNYSFMNPASLSALNYSTFNVGANMDLGKFKTNNSTQNFSNAGFNYISLAMPLKKIKSGLAFGLFPYSDVGYNIINIKDSGGVAVRNEFQGSGGLSKVNIALGTNISKYISFGVNFSHVFGQIAESERRRYPGNRFMTSYSDNMNLFIKGNRLDLGLQLHTSSNAKLSQVLGIVLSTTTQLKGERDRLVFTYNEIVAGDTLVRDILINEKAQNAKITLPQSLNISYSIGKFEKWQATAGVGTTSWSKYKSVFGDNGGLVNDKNYSLGFFVCPTPHFDASIKGNKFGRYFKSIRYSAGFHHNDGYIVVGNTTISDNGISVGLGFPFTRVNKTPDGGKVNITSRIFLTGEFVRRGTVTNTLIQEDFFKFTLGLNLADNWFKKRLFN